MSQGHIATCAAHRPNYTSLGPVKELDAIIDTYEINGNEKIVEYDFVLDSTSASHMDRRHHYIVRHRFDALSYPLYRNLHNTCSNKCPDQCHRDQHSADIEQRTVAIPANLLDKGNRNTVDNMGKRMLACIRIGGTILHHNIGPVDCH